MTHEPIQPDGWKAPKGYVNGMVAAPGSSLVFIAGQIAWDADQRLVSDDFTDQFRQALANVVAVVEKAGGAATDLVSLTVYVSDKRTYLERAKELGPIWRDLCGRHYPTMALVEVADLLEEGAQVEIQGIAVVSR